MVHIVSMLISGTLTLGCPSLLPPKTPQISNNLDTRVNSALTPYFQKNEFLSLAEI